jgi:hypothetical protein
LSRQNKLIDRHGHLGRESLDAGDGLIQKPPIEKD